LSSKKAGYTKRAILKILEKIEDNIKKVDDEQVEAMIEEIIYTKAKDGRIFVAGTGRTGLVGKAFAMRLYHLGFDVVVLGETIVPSANKRDCLIAISGSGRTDFTVDSAALARKIGARVIAITSDTNSPLAKMSDITVIVKGRTKEALTLTELEKDKLKDAQKVAELASGADKIKWEARQLTGLHAPLSPLGSLFELTLMMFLEGVIATLIDKLKIGEEEIKARHANIETISF